MYNILFIICFFIGENMAYAMPVIQQNIQKKEVGKDTTNCILESDWTSSNLKGKVKSIRTITYHVSEKFGEIAEDSVYDYGTKEIFDEEGFFVHIETYNSLCEIESRKEYSRYPNGCLIGAKVWNSDTLAELYELSYNFKNWAVDLKMYNEKYQLISVTKSKFDKKGKETESVTYNAEGKKIASSTKYEKVGNINLTLDYEYDEDGNVTNITTLVNDINQKKRVYSFVGYGGGDTYGILEKYNQGGEVIEEQTSTETSSILYEYVYDKNKNWIKQLAYSDNVPITLTKRTIDYY